MWMLCSARELSAQAALLGRHALDVVEGLTVRLQRRDHVEMPESFRSAIISQVASLLASLQVTEEGGLGERPPSNTTGSLEKTASRSRHEVLDRSRSALGLFPPVVAGDGLDADEQAVGNTDCPTMLSSLRHGMTSTI